MMIFRLLIMTITGEDVLLLISLWGSYGGFLAGVALLNYAYEVMLTAFDTADTPDCQAHVIQALKVMSHKTGLTDAWRTECGCGK